MGNNKDKASLSNIKGLVAVDPKKLANFKLAMTNEVIPAIVKKVEKRRLAAAKNRHKQLKC